MVNRSYNSLLLNVDCVDCDYYHVLRAEETGAVYTGKFMNQYSWAEDVAGSLNHLMD